MYVSTRLTDPLHIYNQQKKKGSAQQKKRAIRRLEDGSGQAASRDPLMERLGEIINQVRGLCMDR
jgi:hypothetical protein